MTDLVTGTTVDVIEPSLTFDVIQQGYVEDVLVVEGPRGADGAAGAPGEVSAAQLAAASAADRARANHTGTQSLDTTTDSASRLAMTSAERTKLSGVATGATANATDAQLRDRSTHTGTQAASTITGLGTAATVNTGTASGQVALLNANGRYDIARLASGTPDGTKFVRDDGTLATPAGGGSSAPIARKSHRPASRVDVATTSTTPVAIDSTNLTVTFTAPTSGAVRVVLEGLGTAPANNFLAWGLLDSGGTYVTGTARWVMLPATNTDAVRVNTVIYISGLTPAASITYRWAHAVGTGTGYLTYGGADPSGPGPAVMEVFAA